MTVQPKTCPECGAPIARPRRNQTFCSAACRYANKARRKHTNRHVVFKRTCDWCGERFDAKRPHARFCSTACQQAFNNFWKAKGPKLAAALFDFRVRRVKGAFTELCGVFADCRADQKVVRRKARKGKE